jgi:hypothetical protein
MTVPSRPLAVCLALVFAAAAAAEVPKPPENISRYRQAVYQMRSGNVRVKENPQNRETLKVVAQWLAFTICTPPYNGEQPPASDKTPIGVKRDMSEIMADAHSLSDIRSGTTAKPGQEQIEFADEWGKAIAEAAGVVLANSQKPIERINAIRLMAESARIPAPSLAGPLVAVVKNQKASDAEKLYAFQGLKNLLAQDEDVDNPGRHVFGGTVTGNPKLAEIGTALSDYVFQKRTPRDDKERAVIEFIRRDAVAALAQFKDGVIRKANHDLLFRPAWAMARVMENDPAAYPPFTMQEQMEAATGLAHMKIDPDMNPDVAAYSMAKVLVNAARAANLDGERVGSTGTLPVVQWKLVAARWSYALSVWRENAKAGPIRDVANAGIGLLTTLEKEGAAGRTQAGVQDVTTWATNNPPKAWAEMKPATLFKDDPNSVLPFPAAPAAPAPTPMDPKLTTPAAPKGTPLTDPKTKKGTEPKKGGPAPKKPGG